MVMPFTNPACLMPKKSDQRTRCAFDITGVISVMRYLTVLPMFWSEIWSLLSSHPLSRLLKIAVSSCGNTDYVFVLDLSAAVTAETMHTCLSFPCMPRSEGDCCLSSFYYDKRS